MRIHLLMMKRFGNTFANTGQSLKVALKKGGKIYTGETFMMIMAMVLQIVDINDLLSFHQAHEKLATVTGINPAPDSVN